jgi:hypothetical protein
MSSIYVKIDTAMINAPHALVISMTLEYTPASWKLIVQDAFKLNTNQIGYARFLAALKSLHAFGCGFLFALTKRKKPLKRQTSKACDLLGWCPVLVPD